MLLANLWHKIILKALDALGWRYLIQLNKGLTLYFRIAHHTFCLPSKILSTNFVSSFSLLALQASQDKSEKNTKANIFSGKNKGYRKIENGELHFN